MNEGEFPALFGAADIVSKRAQKLFFLALGGNLTCLVAASVVSSINSPTKESAYLQAALLLLGLALVIYLAHSKPQRAWYRSRALAESVRTVSWRYMMKAEPYDEEDKVARIVFLNVLEKLMRSNPQAVSQAIDTLTDAQITESMRRVRALTLPERVSFYRIERIKDQLSWYRKKSAENKRLSSGWFSLLVSINLAAIACSYLRVGNPLMTEWPTEILVATAGALMAWLQTKRFQELAESYGLTAHEISLLDARLEDHQDCERGFSRFVGDAEMAFSREHTQWQARADEQ